MAGPAFPRLLGAGLLVAATAFGPAGAAETLDTRLEEARAETAAAARDTRRLEQAAARARGDAEVLVRRQQAAAAAMAEAEARLTESALELARAEARLALQRRQMARQQAPVAALLGGLVTMGRQPPLLAMADGGSLRDLVRIRQLLAATEPWIARRTAALSRQIAAGDAQASAARAARGRLAERRKELAFRQAAFARLEREAEARAASLDLDALRRGDDVLAGSESVAVLAGEAARERSARQLGRALAQLDGLPPRPFAPEGRAEPAPILYQLPARAPVVEGMGRVSAAGIRARGIRLDTPRGTTLVAPGDGRLAFAGPYRGEDGVVIIDHGQGWLTLMLGVASDRPTGATVRRGEPLGRALGPVTVELSTHGRHVSAALIAGSSDSLSNGGKGR